MALLMAGIYPLSVLTFTWNCVLHSDLEGGRHGPLDAYRHALASSVVSYTIGAWAVNLITFVFESGSKDSNGMDRHNNRLGARLGADSHSFSSLERTVRQSVSKGGVHATDVNQITWLPEEKWRDSKLW